MAKKEEILSFFIKDCKDGYIYIELNRKRNDSIIACWFFVKSNWFCLGIGKQLDKQATAV